MRLLAIAALLVLASSCDCTGAVGQPGESEGEGGGEGDEGEGAGEGEGSGGEGEGGGPCTVADDCQSDTACVGGVCTPFGSGGTPDHDPACTTSVDIGALVPDVQCAWTEPAAGDAAPDNNQVMSTPVVVDLDLDDDPATLHPSIIFTTFTVATGYGAPGVLRVIDGATCTDQMSAPTVPVMSPAGPAVADITGDGKPEIVLAGDDPASPGGLIAFTVDRANHVLVELWRSADCSGGGRVPDAVGGRDRWSGPSIIDLDDDGVPEIVYGATVYGADGCLKSTSAFPAYAEGVIPVLADVDEDGKIELVLGDQLLEWSTALSTFVPDPLFIASAANVPGQVAVADFGDFPVAALGGADVAEIAVVSSGTVRVQTVEGTVVFGPFPIAGGGTGGPPTIADFDGDGRAEFATAAADDYAVYDLDCVPGGDPAKCATGGTGGVLWQQPVQDHSSNVTGSSIFDFNFDGKAEAVYADECFLRIFDGATGTVLYSASRSSGTTYENPLIVDVDGDFKSEIVTSVNDYGGNFGCPADDPLKPGTPNVPSHGIIVLRDAQDRWAASRPIWNQHAYSVTNVDDRGVVPRTSQAQLNWRTPGLNNFRENVQGDLEALGAGDLTARGTANASVCANGTITLAATVCNRGTLPVAAGTPVAFADPAGAELCRATVSGALDVGACGDVSCDAPSTEFESGITVDVTVVVDPDATIVECHEGNNRGTIAGVACVIIGG